MENSRSLAKVVTAALSFALAGPAGATGITVARFGGEQGHPMAANPTAIYYNPAALAFIRGSHVYVEGQFALRSLTYDRPTGAEDHPPAAGAADPTGNSGEAKLSNFLVSPFVGAASDLGVENLGVGLGFYVPFGGQATWDKNSAFAGNAQYPGAVDGVQRWHDIEGTIRSSYVTAAAGYRFPFGLSVGLGANLVLSVVDDVRAANADGSDDPLQPDGSLLEGRADLNVSNTTLSLGAGLAYSPIPELLIGLSYQSQPGFGVMSYDGTLRRKFGAGAINTDQVEYTNAMPDIIRLGARYRVTPSIELRLWGSYERWSAFDKQCIMTKAVANRNCDLDATGKPKSATSGVINNIPRDWTNAINLRASGSYFVSRDLELQLGLGFDGNAVPDSTMDASLPDSTNMDATLGVVLGLLDHKLTVMANLVAVFGPTRDVPTRRAGTVYPYVPPSLVPDAGGTYKEFIGVLQVGVGYHF